MVTKEENPESLLGLFNFGHPKNVQNRFLESLSHAKKRGFFNIFTFSLQAQVFYFLSRTINNMKNDR